MSDSAQDEATMIARMAAVISAILVLVAGVAASVGLFQASAVALLAGLATSIASVVGRPGRGARFVAPSIIGVAMVTVIVAGYLPR